MLALNVTPFWSYCKIESCLPGDRDVFPPLKCLGCMLRAGTALRTEDPYYFQRMNRSIEQGATDFDPSSSILCHEERPTALLSVTSMQPLRSDLPTDPYRQAASEFTEIRPRSRE